MYSANEFCHSDIIYLAYALDIYRTLPMCVRILTQKSEEATASSASLLTTPLHYMLAYIQFDTHTCYVNHWI